MQVGLRSATTSDREFLFTVFASTREEELAQVDWPMEQKTTFLRSQFEAQDKHYRQQFNIYADPHAAERVLQSGLPVTLVPLDVGMQVALARDAIRRLTVGTADPVTRFLGDATAIGLAYAEKTEGAAVFPLLDPLAVAVAIDPTLVRLTPLHVEVDTEGQATRGRTVANPRSGGSRKTPFNVQATAQLDTARALALVQERLCRK